MSFKIKQLVSHHQNVNARLRHFLCKWAIVLVLWITLHLDQLRNHLVYGLVPWGQKTLISAVLAVRPTEIYSCFLSLSPHLLYQFAGAAIIKYYSLGGLNTRNIFPHRSRGCTFKIERPAGGDSSEDLSPWLLADCPLGESSHGLLPACVCVLITSPYKNTSHWIRKTLTDLHGNETFIITK